MRIRNSRNFNWFGQDVVFFVGYYCRFQIQVIQPCLWWMMFVSTIHWKYTYFLRSLTVRPLNKSWLEDTLSFCKGIFSGGRLETIYFQKNKVKQNQYQVGKSHKQTKTWKVEIHASSSASVHHHLFSPPSIHRKELKRPRRRNAMDPKATNGPSQRQKWPPAIPTRWTTKTRSKSRVYGGKTGEDCIWLDLQVPSYIVGWFVYSCDVNAIGSWPFEVMLPSCWVS